MKTGFICFKGVDGIISYVRPEEVAAVQSATKLLDLGKRVVDTEFSNILIKRSSQLIKVQGTPKQVAHHLLEHDEENVELD